MLTILLLLLESYPDIAITHTIRLFTPKQRVNSGSRRVGSGRTGSGRAGSGRGVRAGSAG